MAWGTKSGTNKVAGLKPQVIPAHPEITQVVNKVMQDFQNANAFGIPVNFARDIVRAFNNVESISTDRFAFTNEDGVEKVFYPAKITHKGASAGTSSFSAICPDYGERAMAFGSLAASLQWAFANHGPIEGVSYSVFTEYSNTNWNAVGNNAERNEVLRNTYSVYRMYITPIGNGQAMTISKCYTHRSDAKPQATSSEATTAPPVSAQGWGNTGNWNK